MDQLVGGPSPALMLQLAALLRSEWLCCMKEMADNDCNVCGVEMILSNDSDVPLLRQLECEDDDLAAYLLRGILDAQ